MKEKWNSSNLVNPRSAQKQVKGSRNLQNLEYIENMVGLISKSIVKVPMISFCVLSQDLIVCVEGPKSEGYSSG